MSEKKKKKWNETWWGILLILFVVLFIFSFLNSFFFFFYTSTNQQEPKLTLSQIQEQAIEVSYNDLYRNNENYLNKIVKFEGEIVQTIKTRNGYDYRIDVTKTYPSYGGVNYEDTIWAHYYNGDKRFLEEDIVEFYAEVKGLSTYETIFGETKELPNVEILYINLLNN